MAIALMKNLKQATKLKKSQKGKMLQLFLVSTLLTIGELKISSSLVLAKSNELISTTATYEDPENPSVKINATSNDTTTKDLTINNDDLLFDNELSETDIFLIDSAWEIFLEYDF